MLTYPEQNGVHAVTDCTLTVGTANWPYARINASAIDAHWQSAARDNPGYFNGTIHLVDTLVITGDKLSARLFATEFKNYLHWRDTGFPAAGVRDGFGSALLTSSDGAYVLGRQRDGNINAGLTYLPGGFIDARDVHASGNIDIAASIMREVSEETGLDAASLRLRPGLLVTEAGAHLSFAKQVDAPVDAESLAARIRQHIAADPDAELEDAVIIRTKADIDNLPMPLYARILLTTLLTNGSGSP